MKIVAAPAVVGVVVPTVREQFTYSDRRAKQGFVSWPGSIVSAGIEGPSIQGNLSLVSLCTILYCELFSGKSTVPVNNAYKIRALNNSLSFSFLQQYFVAYVYTLAEYYYISSPMFATKLGKHFVYILDQSTDVHLSVSLSVWLLLCKLVPLFVELSE